MFTRGDLPGERVRLRRIVVVTTALAMVAMGCGRGAGADQVKADVPRAAASSASTDPSVVAVNAPWQSTCIGGSRALTATT